MIQLEIENLEYARKKLLTMPIKQPQDDVLQEYIFFRGYKAAIEDVWKKRDSLMAELKTEDKND